MQVWVAVNEADVANIYPGQPVTFTVDALPNETFKGEVVKVRLNASMTQNVVTYTVEIVTDNSTNRLLPYLTANVKFEVGRRENALLVPNAALRWAPYVEQVAPEYRSGLAAGPPPILLPRQLPAESNTRDKSPSRPGVIYAREGQFVRPVPVMVGLSDGMRTEVVGEGLTEEIEIVTGVDVAADASTDASNPFAPKLPPPPKGGPPPP